jgi:hypothetical protein
MNKLEQKIELYKSKIKEIEPDFDEVLLEKITRSLVPSIYNKDAETISCSQTHEIEYVRENFLKGKLALDLPDPDLVAAIEEVCEKMGRSNPKKYRAIFYYFLVKKFGKEHLYA